MILVGIDDTDTLDSPGTNHVARAVVRELPPEYRCRRIVRHQLLFDPRVPYTSKNSSCSLLLERADGSNAADDDAESLRDLFEHLRESLLARFQPGSDPGLCVCPAAVVADEFVRFGLRCKRSLATQAEAREIAARHDLLLDGLGGTNDGVIGALSAVGLASTGDDGRVVEVDGLPDDLSGVATVEQIAARGVQQIRCRASGQLIVDGRVDVGKHLRPNLRGDRVVLIVETHESGCWQAVREL